MAIEDISCCLDPPNMLYAHLIDKCDGTCRSLHDCGIFDELFQRCQLPRLSWLRSSPSPLRATPTSRCVDIRLPTSDNGSRLTSLARRHCDVGHVCYCTLACRSLAVGNGRSKRSAREYSLHALAALNGLLSEGRSGARPVLRGRRPAKLQSFLALQLAAGQKDVGNFEACPQTSRTDLFNLHRLPRRTEAAEPSWPRNHAQSGVQISSTSVVVLMASQADAEGNTASSQYMLADVGCHIVCFRTTRQSQCCANCSLYLPHPT
jgi:hypothetical protein